jgi:uncharacterized membrane protein YkoI
MLALLAGATIGTAATAAITVSRAEEPGRPAANAPTEPRPGLLPLDTLLAEIEKKHRGRVTEIELERRPWGDHYELELTDASFREWDIVVDARTGELLRENRDFD